MALPTAPRLRPWEPRGASLGLSAATVPRASRPRRAPLPRRVAARQQGGVDSVEECCLVRCALADTPAGRGLRATPAGIRGAGETVREIYVRCPLGWTLGVCEGGKGAPKEGSEAYDLSWAKMASRARRDAGEPSQPRALRSALADKAGRSDAERLSIYLLWAARRAPFWRSHARSLAGPEESTAATRFEPQHFEAMRDSRLEAFCVEERARLKAIAQAAAEAAGLALEEEVRLDEAEWALHSVITRAFSICVPPSAETSDAGGAGYVMLLPGLDLANMGRVPNMRTEVDPALDSLILRARHEGVTIAAGDEIQNTYGVELSNAELLVKYGFVLEQNPNDRLPTRAFGEAEEGGSSSRISAARFLSMGGLGAALEAAGAAPEAAAAAAPAARRWIAAARSVLAAASGARYEGGKRTWFDEAAAARSMRRSLEMYAREEGACLSSERNAADLAAGDAKMAAAIAYRSERDGLISQCLDVLSRYKTFCEERAANDGKRADSAPRTPGSKARWQALLE